MNLYANGTSLVDTIDSLRESYGAPSEVVMFPRGIQACVKPQGAVKPMTFVVDESWAKLFAHHLDRMKAGGSKPYFDFWHSKELGHSGWPQKIYWAAERGVCALVEWSPEARELILTGKCNSFSPTWTHMEGDHPYGVGLCMGGLLSSDKKPALQRMPPIKPERRRDTVKLLAKRFMQFVESRLPDYKASQFGIIECYAAVAQEFPDLYRAHVLLQAIRKEAALDVEVAYA
ncbi:MAG TPA: phage protease [Verrucomicrobiae bacterium]|nr:phage protease [Verrucomicrobiae bacterium]